MIKINQNYFEKVKGDFEIKPFSVYMTPKQINESKFYIYKKINNNYYIPRFYNRNLYHVKEIDDLERTNVKFRGELRDSQVGFVNNVIKLLKKFNGCILSVPPGFGKTIMSIYVSTKLKLKTLVIVHKTFLLNQWMESLKLFSNHEIGIIQGKKIDIEGKTIVIGMLQSLSMKEYEDDIYNYFDFLIVDEVHHIATKSFSNALLKFNFHFSLGLSATPNRKDGLTRVYQYFLGNDIVNEKQNIQIKKCLEERKKKVIVHRHKFIPKKNDPLFKSITMFHKKDQYNMSKMISNISISKERNDFVYKILKENFMKRYVLILSSRVLQLEELYERFQKEFPKIKSSLFIGKMSMKDLSQTLKSNVQIIFGTYEFISEGFDYPKLNTLFLITPRTDIVQICGRILRKVHSDPIIFDIWDDIIPFNLQAKKRLMYYKTSNFTIS